MRACVVLLAHVCLRWEHREKCNMLAINLFETFLGQKDTEQEQGGHSHFLKTWVGTEQRWFIMARISDWEDELEGPPDGHRTLKDLRARPVLSWYILFSSTRQSIGNIGSVWGLKGLVLGLFPFAKSSSVCLLTSYSSSACVLSATLVHSKLVVFLGCAGSVHLIPVCFS